MKTCKLIPLLITTAALALTASVSAAVETVIHTGESYVYSNFNTNIGSLDTTSFTTGAASVKLTYTAQQNVVFNSTTPSMLLADISANDSLTFDYNTTSVTAFYRIRLFAWTGAANVLLSDNIINSPGFATPNTQGEWSSVTLTGLNWTAYDTAITNNTVNNTTPYLLRIGFQNLSAAQSGEINIDNIRLVNPTAVPEPSSFALLASVGAGVMAATRRRRRA